MTVENPNTLDLPEDFESPNILPDLVDANFSTYQLQTQGNAQVYVEKYVIEKKYYVPFKGASLGSAKKDRPGCVLIKEDGFIDIGGGYASFHRHYARVPDSWADYETKSVLFWFSKGVFSSLRIGINYDYGCGSLPVGFRSCGFGFYYERRNLNLQAKATRYYLTQELLEKYINNQFILPGSGASWAYNPTLPKADTENDYTTLTTLGEKRVLPSRLILSEPRVKTDKSDDREMVVALDSIRKWQASIYELTRYTSQLQPHYVTSVSVLTMQVQYRYASEVTQEQINATQVTIGNEPNAQAETYTTVASANNPADDFNTSFAFVVSGGLSVQSVTTTGGTSNYETASISTTWNGLDEVIFITVLLNNGEQT